jgi:hypothetical protein
MPEGPLSSNMTAAAADSKPFRDCNTQMLILLNSKHQDNRLLESQEQPSLLARRQLGRTQERGRQNVISKSTKQLLAVKDSKSGRFTISLQ